MDYLRYNCRICKKVLIWKESKDYNQQVCEANCGHKFHRRCINYDQTNRYSCPVEKCRSRSVYLHGPSVHLVYNTKYYNHRRHFCENKNCHNFFFCFLKLDVNDKRSICSCQFYHCQRSTLVKSSCPWRRPYGKPIVISLDTHTYTHTHPHAHIFINFWYYLTQYLRKVQQMKKIFYSQDALESAASSGSAPSTSFIWSFLFRFKSHESTRSSDCTRET